METNEQKQINKDDLINKAVILNQIVKDFEEAKGDPVSGIAFLFKDRTITYKTYQGKADVKKNLVPVTDGVIDTLIVSIKAEADALQAAADAIKL